MAGEDSGHPLFRRFAAYEGWAEPGFERSYFGANFRDWLFTGEPKGLAGRQVRIGFPPVSDEYFEWIALAGAVATAVERFRMCELGAGWGRWSVYAAMLCRQREIPFTLTAAEPEPAHFEWLKTVFRDNGIDPARHHLYEAAVAPRGGEVRLAGVDDPLHEYGHYVSTGIGGRLRERRGGHAARTVRAVTLRDLLQLEPAIDFIDMDVQGVEDELIESVDAGALDRVRIVHVGTHSRKIEARLEQAFTQFGWLSVFAFPCYAESATPYGGVRFEDGAQTWVHPRHPELRDLLLGQRQ